MKFIILEYDSEGLLASREIRKIATDRRKNGNRENVLN